MIAQCGSVDVDLSSTSTLPPVHQVLNDENKITLKIYLLVGGMLTKVKHVTAYLDDMSFQAQV